MFIFQQKASKYDFMSTHVYQMFRQSATTKCAILQLKKQGRLMADKNYVLLYMYYDFSQLHRRYRGVELFEQSES